MASKVRLYVDHPLGEGQLVPLSREQAHYLFGVMRLVEGTVLSLINGRDGEWDAEVAQAGKRGGALGCLTQTKPLQMPPDLWLLFSPIRKERMSYLVEKATELGAARLMPVQTSYTNNGDRVRLEKLQAQVIEATEQSGGTYVPQMDAPQKLKAVLQDWPDDRPLYFCDEVALGVAAGFADVPPSDKAAILIGPEGGFAPDEREMLTALPYTHVIGLGPRILRAETAAVAALTLWQQQCGDWR
jgi:16S rRNA (uracil1498-N3)-methyltransferase